MSFLPGAVRTHLERCPGCRDFLHSLGTFSSVLRNELDEALQDYPVPEFAAILREVSRQGAGVPPLQKHRAGAIPAALGRIGTWLFGPAGKPAVVYRWAAVSAIAVLLASLIGIRIHSVHETRRAIQQQIDRVVELIYQEPLLPGIESALLRTQPTISDYVEDLDRTIDLWFEETVSQSYFN
jgi:hypothetical protein